MTSRIAPLFISHGSPNLISQPLHKMSLFLSNLSTQIHLPKAIVIFSAHWEESIEESGMAISFHENEYKTIHDFQGFSKLSQVSYPAKGSPETALLIETLLNQKNIKTRREYERGLDHGSWVVLGLMFPDFNIPVVQCSIDPKSSAETHFQIGQALKELSEREILVIASGGTVHNLLEMNSKKNQERWALEFDDWLIDQISKRNLQELFQYRKFAPHHQLAIPRSEHFIPLFIVMGMASDETTSSSEKVLFRDYDYGSRSYLSFSF